ncbi:MAG: hypothetical protein AB2535_19120 [Candidatus Thiodiazotropha endolucinida]
MGEDFEFNCRLFVHSKKDIQQLRESIVGISSGIIIGSSIETDYMHIKLSKWNGFDPDRINEHRGFLHYKYSAEIDSISDFYENKGPVNPEVFCEQLCNIIKELREQGDLVVASSDYEDVVVEKTGWNWSESTPVHP